MLTFIQYFCFLNLLAVDTTPYWKAVKDLGFAIAAAALLVLFLCSLVWKMYTRGANQEDKTVVALENCEKAIQKLEEVVRTLHHSSDLGVQDKLDDLDKSIAELNSTYRAAFNLLLKKQIPDDR